MAQVNWIDVIALLLVIRLGYMGLRLGVVAELTKLFGVLVGLFVGLRWSLDATAWVVAHSFLNEAWAGVMILAGLVVGSYLAVVIALRLLQKAATLHVAPMLDKAGGLIVATVRAALIASLAAVAVAQLPSPYLRTSLEERSWSGRYLSRLAPMVYAAAAAVTPHP